MKIEKKRGLKKFRITHNRKLFWLIILLIVILGFLIYFIVKNAEQNNNSAEKECEKDTDCIKACGCHPDSCVPAAAKGDCEGLICTQECSGPLDCGAGYCGCINYKCSVIKNK